MTTPIKSVFPTDNDRFAVQVNKAEIDYDKGFGRRYTLNAGLSLLKCAASSLYNLIQLVDSLILYAFRADDEVTETMKEQHKEEVVLAAKSAVLLAKSSVIGVAKLFASIIADPIKLACEAYERKQCPHGRAALLVIDAQSDFTVAGEQEIDGVKHTYKDGGLGVKDGFAIVPVINKLMKALAPGNINAASLDWHPKRHKSFSSSTPGTAPFETIRLVDTDQTLWTDHCVQGTKGAGFLSGLHVDKIQYVVRKGLDLFVDSYSAFFDNGNTNQTALDEYLKGCNVKRVYVTGIATDYCVKFTALDAKALGYDVTLVVDASRGVDIGGSVASAIAELRSKGVHVITSEEALKLADFIR